MKKLAAALALLLCLGLPVKADFRADTDYMAIMLDAATRGDMEEGLEAQRLRDEKIILTESDQMPVDFKDMLLLAKVIEAEAGSCWLDLDWKMAVGEVLINRLASPEFPDTIEEVITQPGQYYGKNNSFFNSLLPSWDSALAASKLLGGERVLNEPSVVFQANFVLGSGVFLELEDGQLGSTYLCYSSHPELYEE